MKYIKKVTNDAVNEALKKFYDVASKEDFWEVKGLYAFPTDLCYSTIDDNCFMCYTPKTQYFVYFAIEQGKMSNIRGLFEAFYEIVCSGYPYIRFYGRIGRYPKILKAFSCYDAPKETVIKGKEEIVWYAGHPDNIEKIKRRFM